MREKKFRIWDIETKQFFYWDITEQPPTCLTKEYIKENSQEFTGLLDNNGKEIYGGDIVKAHMVNYFVCFHYGAYRCYRDKYQQEYAFEIQEAISREAEVIGNIYEHKNLLKN